MNLSTVSSTSGSLLLLEKRASSLDSLPSGLLPLEFTQSEPTKSTPALGFSNPGGSHVQRATQSGPHGAVLVPSQSSNDASSSFEEVEPEEYGRTTIHRKETMSNAFSASSDELDVASYYHNRYKPVKSRETRALIGATHVDSHLYGRLGATKKGGKLVKKGGRRKGDGKAKLPLGL